MSARFAPIKRKTVVAKPAIWPDLDIAELGEIVYIQLKQVGQDRLLLWRGADYSDIVESLCWAFCHDRGKGSGLNFEYGTPASIRIAAVVLLTKRECADYRKTPHAA